MKTAEAAFCDELLAPAGTSSSSGIFEDFGTLLDFGAFVDLGMSGALVDLGTLVDLGAAVDLSLRAPVVRASIETRAKMRARTWKSFIVDTETGFYFLSLTR